MKPITTLFLILSFLLVGQAQEKISDISNYVQLENYSNISIENSIEFNSIKYAVYFDQRYLVLVNLEDETAAPLKYPIDVPCFDMSYNYNLHARIGNKLYFGGFHTIYAIDLENPESATQIDLEGDYSSPYLRNINDDYIFSSSDNNDTLKMIFVDQVTYEVKKYEFLGYKFNKIIGDDIILKSIDGKSLSVFNLYTEEIKAIYTSSLINQYYDLTGSNDDIILLDTALTLLRLQPGSESFDSICSVSEDLKDFWGVNLKNHIVQGKRNTTTGLERIICTSKIDCQTEFDIPNFSESLYYLESININNQDFIIIIGGLKLLIFNTETDETYTYDINFNTFSPYSIIDETLILFESYNSNVKKLSIIDLTTGERQTQNYQLGLSSPKAVIAANLEDSIVIVAQSKYDLVSIHLSKTSAEYSIRDLTKNVDVGLKKRREWIRTGTSVSNRKDRYNEIHHSLEDEKLTPKDAIDFAEGYYVWDNMLAGVANIDGQSYFTIYNTLTDEIIDQRYLSSQEPSSRHFIVKFADKYYECINGRYLERYPLSGVIPLPNSFNFESTPLLHLKNSFFAIKKNEIDSYSIRKFDNNEETIVKSDLKTQYYQYTTIWKSDDPINLYTFYQEEMDETYLISINSQNGEIQYQQTVEGKALYDNRTSLVKDWITIKFQRSDESSYVLHTDGIELEEFGLPIGLSEYNVQIQSFTANQSLFIPTDDGELYIYNNQTVPQEVPDIFNQLDNLEDVIFRNNKYYLIISNYQENRIITLSVGFDIQEEIFNEAKVSCQSLPNRFIGNIDKDHILLSLNSTVTGNELWKLNTLTNAVELYFEFNTTPLYGFHSFEFISDGNAYIKGADQNSIIQLYKVTLHDENVSNEEIGSSDKALIISPNPSNSLITCNEPIRNAIITSLSGETIWKQSSNGLLISIEINKLNPGLYIVSGLTEKNERILSKFIKM